ncbi:MAG: hypothetical protein OKBPIBMD_00140 [Chlorobi bacterium]|nr:MAG: hypothetical protein UZ06_CHB003001455 [Chlorobi bacterium OLB6]MBV6462725.1 hypothetical protein [Chlorobiota bacterium]MBW7852626.1 T9SS type A sorting domain-containing protein [Candidatus Kapabacteria bacterium]MCC6331114.1 T9SS type A sorting domain-containing protein [Ignavibacteria bacterium]MCL4277068.1 T9SS type A sorting domain-containing protein [Ignavibacteria bacterium]
MIATSLGGRRQWNGRHVVLFGVRLVLLAFVLNCQAIARTSHDEGTVVLRYYDLVNGFGELHDSHDQTLQSAARFPIHGEIQLDSIRLKVNGKLNDSAIVRIYGHEGGAPAPVLGLDQCEPKVIRKSTNGVEYCLIAFDPPINLAGDQFFVSMESMSGKMALLSDNVARAPMCLCEGEENFTLQCVRREDGPWQTINRAYLVDAYVQSRDVVAHESYFHFGLDTIYSGSPEVIPDATERPFIATVDLNRDGQGEILTSKGLLHSRGPARQWQLDSTVSTARLGVEMILPRRCRNGDFELIGIRRSSHDRIAEQRRTADGVRIRVLEISDEAAIVSVVVADFNTDRSEDVLVAKSNGACGLFRFNERDEPENATPLILKSEQSRHLVLHNVVATDVDADGDADIVGVCTEEGSAATIVQAINQAGGNSEGVTHRLEQFTVLHVPYGVSGLYLRPTISINGVVDAQTSEDHIVGAGIAINMVRIPSPRQTEIPIADQWSMDVLSRLPFEDRVSACSWPDLDGNGVAELMMTTGSTCRPPKLYREDPTDRRLQREYHTGLETLRNVRDICWGDIDGDGAVDGVTLSEGNIVVLWNQTRQSLPARRRVELQPWVRGIEDGGRVCITQISSGRGWDVHERLLDYPLVRSDLDSVWVHTTDMRRERTSYASFVAVTPARRTERHADGVDECQPKVSANPFNIGITIDLIGRGEITGVSVYALDGVLVWSQSIPCHSAYWDGMNSNGSRAAAGSYVIKVDTRSCTGIVRVVKVD